jgi:hypothetical protein
MMRIHVFALVLTSLAVGAFAQASTPPKYRVTEVAALPEAGICLPGYAISMTGGGVSDRGVVPGNILCYANVEFGNGVVLPSRSVNRAFVWNRVTGAMEVAPPPESSTPYLYNIDAAGTVYGWMGNQTGLNGVRWTPAAGFETVITKSPDCFLNISFAIGGNAAGNIVGAAYRQDGVSEFPTEWTCVFRWVFRDAVGNEIVGPPQNQTPSRMNQRNVAVGQVNQSAVKWLPQEGNALITLDQASPGFMSYALGINNRDVVVGMAGVDTGQIGCWSDAVGMVWGRDNEGRSLSSLPRMTNGEAWSIDDEGTIYGHSSMGADACAKRSWEANRGTIWRHFRTYDLNKLLIGPPGVTITTAARVNSKGQILAYGFRTRDPLKDCPEVGAPPEGGDPYLIPGKCRDQLLYLLTPL